MDTKQTRTDSSVTALPPDVRELLLRHGWIHASEVDAISSTCHSGRRRWNIPHAMIGNERYLRLDDILERLDNSYSSHAQSMADKAEDERKVNSAIA